MSARSGFDGVLNSSTDGLPLIGIECTVYDANDEEATIYAAKTGGSQIPQPIETSSGNGGLIQFWVEPGYYEIGVEDTEPEPRITPRRIPFNAVAGDADGISSNQIEIITANEIDNNAVTESKILNLAVSQGKIANNAVSFGKLVAPTEGTPTVLNSHNVASKVRKYATNQVVLWSVAELASFVGTRAEQLSGGSVMTIPEGYRPTGNHISFSVTLRKFNVGTNLSTFTSCWAQVNTSGVFTLQYSPAIASNEVLLIYGNASWLTA